MVTWTNKATVRTEAISRILKWGDAFIWPGDFGHEYSAIYHKFRIEMCLSFLYCQHSRFYMSEYLKRKLSVSLVWIGPLKLLDTPCSRFPCMSFPPCQFVPLINVFLIDVYKLIIETCSFHFICLSFSSISVAFMEPFIYLSDQRMLSWSVITWFDKA